MKVGRRWNGVLIERSSGANILQPFKPLKTPPTQDTNFRILSSMSSLFRLEDKVATGPLDQHRSNDVLPSCLLSI
ncbi:hypothetical protein EVAR_56173_1 [Eumeta japonica]|uniref:Uncharacterized protein n=1 Tax=Eumeta variegata TaxID=151549 RepID=A0A4C1ZXC0_EUMVA|nr:hypothetical protein EVAR_56173_1 [Eumeta japonica]